jgi:hypothetical protein
MTGVVLGKLILRNCDMFAEYTSVKIEGLELFTQKSILLLATKCRWEQRLTPKLTIHVRTISTSPLPHIAKPQHHNIITSKHHVASSLYKHTSPLPSQALIWPLLPLATPSLEPSTSPRSPHGHCCSVCYASDASRRRESGRAEWLAFGVRGWLNALIGAGA